MQMEEAKQIIKVASTFLAEQEPAAKINRLEQIEERSGGGEWSVVLSFPDETGMENLYQSRVYKELVVDGRSKEVIALKIWK